MPEPRGEQGTVRGMPGEVVRGHMLAAVAALAPKQGEKARFTRAWLREFFTKQRQVAEDAADALAHAFFRTVYPVSQGEGEYELPDDARPMVVNRGWRFPTGNLPLGDTKQLVELLDQAEADGGVLLAPGLRAFRERAGQALVGLGVRPSTRRRARARRAAAG